MKHSRLLKNHYIYLVDNLDSKYSGLVSRLFAADVLDPRDKEDIEAVKSASRRNERLVSLLSRKTPEQFERFLEALVQTGQRHVWCKITGNAADPGTGTVHESA